MMFSRTPVAKQFRRWVLDVLDKLEEEERAKTELVKNLDRLPFLFPLSSLRTERHREREALHLSGIRSGCGRKYGHGSTGISGLRNTPSFRRNAWPKRGITRSAFIVKATKAFA